MEKLNCVIERVTFCDVLNGYSIIKVLAQGFDDIVTAVGKMPRPHAGACFDLYGDWTIDGRYGRQFVFKKFINTLPTTVEGIKKYLRSGVIEGIGPTYAEKIVEAFGEKTFEIFDNEPERLCEIPGIRSARLEKIKRSWQEQKKITNAAEQKNKLLAERMARAILGKDIGTLEDALKL